jgi:hypothetical protein
MKRLDHWVWLRNTFSVTAVVVLIGFAAAPRVVRAACTGDCGNVNTVTVPDIVTMVNIALGTAEISTCDNGDANDDGQITVDEILQAVNNALAGCGGAPGCGNGVVEASLNEECDDGGTCLGGSDAGKSCTAEADCGGDFGVCTTGDKTETACDTTDPNACDGGTCKKCVAQGGDGCASNCTSETTIVMPLVPGVNPDATSLKPGTSGSVVWNGVLGPLGLAMTGTQTLVVGKARTDDKAEADGVQPNEVPVVVNYVHIDQINVADLSCACVRGVSDMTCGGMLIEADGKTLAKDCTPLYIGGVCSEEELRSCTTKADCTGPYDIDCNGGVCSDCRVDDECLGTCVKHVCDGKPPCSLVHGMGGTCSVTTTQTCGPKAPCPVGETCVQAGNLSSGVIKCVTGLKGTNMLMTEDSKREDGQEDPPACNYNDPDTFVNGSTFPECASPPEVTLTDQNPAPAGAALVLNSTAIGQYVGTCDSEDPNRPAGFCTDEEAYDTPRGLPNTLPAVTNKACSQMTNIFLGNATTDKAVCACQNPLDFDCPESQCTGPLCFTGSPLPQGCSQLTGSTPNVSGLGLAGAFSSPAQATIGDIVVTDVLVAK